VFFLNIKNTTITLSLIGILGLMIIGLIKINVINSKTLSPLGNKNESYNIEEQEIYDSYSSFIKDDSLIKIYQEDSGETLIKVGDRDFRIKKESDIGQYAKNILDKIEVFLASL